ncbi:Hypothetical protein AKI40_3529 [Enterobacter sp. FY-07]|nr:Hypothetical protein AKI40_3529 [Enterobacter sp. FY-07]
MSVALNDPLSRLHAIVACGIPGVSSMPAHSKCSGEINKQREYRRYMIGLWQKSEKKRRSAERRY